MPGRTLALLAVVVAMLAAPVSLRAQAPDPARLAAARELMEVAGVAKQFEEVMPVLAQRLGEAFVAVAPDKAAEIREVFGQVAVKFVDRKGELIEQIAVLYAEKLSAEDMGAVVAFYKSPAGAKIHRHTARDVTPGHDARPPLGIGDRPRDRSGGAPRAQEARHRAVASGGPAEKGLGSAAQPT